MVGWGIWGVKLGRWGVGQRTRLSYRLDLTELSSNGPLPNANCITCIQYWTPDILTFPSHPTPSPSSPGPLVAFYDTTTTHCLCLLIRWLPRNRLCTKCPGCREGKHLQTRWRDGPCKGTRPPRHARVLLPCTLKPIKST